MEPTPIENRITAGSNDKTTPSMQLPDKEVQQGQTADNTPELMWNTRKYLINLKKEVHKLDIEVNGIPPLHPFDERVRSIRDEIKYQRDIISSQQATINMLLDHLGLEYHKEPETTTLRKRKKDDSTKN